MRVQSAPAGRVHVVGAGLAGLAASVELAGRGHSVVLYESGRHAGGRCRSFVDPELGVRIDNGNHLLLSGNRAALAYIERIGAESTFERLPDAAIPFVDLATGERWTVRPSRGAVPWWIFSARGRVPGTRARDYFASARLRTAKPGDTVAAVLDRNAAIFRRLWEPLAVAALNTSVEQASAALLWRVLAETIGRGANACCPMLAREGLSESLVDPALAYLARHGGTIRFGARLQALGFAGPNVAELRFDGDAVPLPAGEHLVLAVPASIAARIVPGLVVPDDYAPIVNAHFRYRGPSSAPAFLGIVGATAEWVFRKGDILSVTVSAADRIVGQSADELGGLLWGDIARALGLATAPMPVARIVKERRATFRATPAQLERRPPTSTEWNNLHLAGDYVDTGLPATIEGAIRSGIMAADRVARGRSPASPPLRFSSPRTPIPTTIRMANARCHDEWNNSGEERCGGSDRGTVSGGA